MQIWEPRGGRGVEVKCSCPCMKNSHQRTLFFWLLPQKLESDNLGVQTVGTQWPRVQMGVPFLAQCGNLALGVSWGLVWLERHPREAGHTITLFSSPSSPSQTFLSVGIIPQGIDRVQEMKTSWKTKWTHLKCIKEPACLHCYYHQTIS